MNTGRQGDDITQCVILADEFVRDNKRYKRFTDYSINNGVYIIRNRALCNDSPVSLENVEEWAAIPEQIAIGGVKQLPIAILKCPQNPRNPKAPSGVPITYGCDATLEKIAKTLNDIEREFEKKKAKVFADRALIKLHKRDDGDTDEIKTRKEFENNDLYVAFNNSDKIGMEIFDPAIRDSAYFNKLERHFAMLEKAGESYRAENENGQKNNTAGAVKKSLKGDTFEKITRNTSDEERARILRNKKIKNIAFTGVLPLEDTERFEKISSWDDIDKIKGNEKRSLILKIAEEFGVFKKHTNDDVKLSFEFSKNNYRESFGKQKKNFQSFAKMFSVFEQVIESAVGVEVHNRNDEGYKPDPTLKNVYVLFSAFGDGDSIIPVKLEVKEFCDKENTLYVAVTLETIKMTEVSKQGTTENGVAQNSRSVNISISDLLTKINPKDVKFLKYIPNELLTDEQIASKNKYENKDLSLNEKKYSRKKTDADYMAAVESGDTETAQRTRPELITQAERMENLNDLKNKRAGLAEEYRELRTQIDEIESSDEYKAFNNEVRTVRKNGSLFGGFEAVKKIRERQKQWADNAGLSKLKAKYDEISEQIHAYDLEIYKAEKAQKEALTTAMSEKVKGFSVNDVEKYVSAAEKRFGTTTKFDNAGYLTSKGKLLDFSDGQGYRVKDHREIRDVLDFLPENSNYSDGLVQFMNMGNIRMQIGGIDVAKAPNEKQIPVLRKFFNENNGEITVDFSKENGDNAGSIEYPKGTSNTRILNDIKKYFETGEISQISNTAAFSYYVFHEENNTHSGILVGDGERKS